LKEKYFNSTLIYAHSPNYVSEIEEKEQFYETLERVYDESPSYDINIVLSDLIAEIGKEECYSPAIEKNRFHDLTNDNNAI
jgi:hypothetical protein